MGAWSPYVSGLVTRVGLGDNLLATGMARGAFARNKIVAFGDGKKIHWDKNSKAIFWRNPNIANPGQENSRFVEWIEFYRGHRIYNRQGAGGRWLWNYEFKAKPGEMYFSDDEMAFGRQFGSGFVVIEPNVPAFKSVAPNKQWRLDRFEVVAEKIAREGRTVVQFAYGGTSRLKHASSIATPSFRHALAALSQAALYIGPEGGLHHGAAAVGVPAVVLFGGFIPPQVTGYDTHTNLTGKASEACGMTTPCAHCRAALDSISVDEVHSAAMAHLTKVAA